MEGGGVAAAGAAGYPSVEGQMKEGVAISHHLSGEGQVKEGVAMAGAFNHFPPTVHEPITHPSSVVGPQSGVISYPEGEAMAGAIHHPPPTLHEPVTHPISVVGPQYMAPYPIDLTITEKFLSLTDGDYFVGDINGNLVFKVKGKLLSLRDKRTLVDPHGNVLVTIRQKILTVHHRWNAFKGDSTDAKDLLFTVRKSTFFQIKTQLDVFLAGNTSEEACDFKIKGSYFDRSCVIFEKDSNVILAKMFKEDSSLKNIVLGKDEFGVTVYPNVDYAFIITLVIILDEINKDRNGAD